MGKRKLKEPCASCKYRGRIELGTRDGLPCCDYILITGTSRKCKPGEGCNKYEKGKPIRVNNFNKPSRVHGLGLYH